MLHIPFSLWRMHGIDLAKFETGSPVERTSLLEGDAG